LDDKATAAALSTGLAGKQATITDGSLTIARTSGLQAALDAKATTSALTTGLAGKQATIGDGDLTVARTSGLQAVLDAKALQSTTFTQTQINALLSSRALASNVYTKSQVDTELATKDFYQLSGTSWINQQAISWVNATLDNIHLGLPSGRQMQWRARPGYGDMTADTQLIKQSQLGHLSLVPPSSCLAYWPMINSPCDQVGGLAWVMSDLTQSQGTYGIFQHLGLRSFAHGGLALLRNTEGQGNYPVISCFPNLSVPTVQPSSSGAGWSSGTWTVEFQTYTERTSTTAPQWYFRLVDDRDFDYNSEVDIGVNAPRNAAGALQVWSLGGSSPLYNIPSDLNPPNQWCHVAMQKASGSNVIYLYIQGVLAATLSPSNTLSSIEKLEFQTFFSDDDHGIFVREIAVWSEARYPTSNNASGVAWTMPSNAHARWNSMML
jgi:hypothetical protein